MPLRCGSCGKEWPSGSRICPDDGGVLIAGARSAGGGGSGGDAREERPTAMRSPPTARAGLEPPSWLEGDDDFDPAQLADVEEDLAPGTLVGDYRVDRKIGEGAMSTVYAVTHTFIAKKAAIKVISPGLSNNREAIFRFVQEARAVNKVGHANIVDIYSFGKLPDGRCYLVMELLQGESLFDRLRRGPPPLGETVEIIDQICVALEAVHAAGVVHRDLKPANVFLVPAAAEGGTPLVKILDFGLVKLDSTSAAPDLTITGAVMGTPHYMSPEQGRADPVDSRSDLYSLGVIAYQLIFGRVPFDADNPIDIAHMHMHAELPDQRDAWPQIPGSVERLVRGLLAKRPAARPTLREVRAALDELRVQAAQGGFASLAPPRPPSRGLAARLRIAAAGVVLAGLAVGALVIRDRVVDRRRLGAATEAVRARMASGQLIQPAGSSASDALVAALERSPASAELLALKGQLVRALKDAARAQVRAAHADAGLALLDRAVALAGGADAETNAIREEARKQAFATRSGMVRVGDSWIDRYEYPNARGVAPLTRVDWPTAGDLCKRAGKHLCTEAEWQRACRGAEDSTFPYGNKYQPSRCATASPGEAPIPAGSRPQCLTPTGVADLSGNVAEWTASPLGPHAPQKVIRGGYWSQSGNEVSCTGRDYFLPGNGGAYYIGFRCCL